jgi:hypothetical protein
MFLCCTCSCISEISIHKHTRAAQTVLVNLYDTYLQPCVHAHPSLRPVTRVSCLRVARSPLPSVCKCALHCHPNCLTTSARRRASTCYSCTPTVHSTAPTATLTCSTAQWIDGKWRGRVQRGLGLGRMLRTGAHPWHFRYLC